MLKLDRREYNSFYYNQRYHHSDEYRERIKQYNRDRYNNVPSVREAAILRSKQRHHRTYVKREKTNCFEKKEVVKSNKYDIDIKEGVFTLTFD